MAQDLTQLHHGYIVEGDRGAALAAVRIFLENEAGVSISGNPDVFIRSCETLTIDDARALKEAQVQKGVGGRGRVFVLAAEFFPTEAQNALLKTFEEPSEGAHFFLIVASREILLPTLRSRLAEAPFAVGGTAEDGNTIDAHEFLRARPAERLILVKPLVDDKDKAGAIALLTALEKACADDVADPEAARFLSNLVRYKGYLYARGASVKLILESLALFAPRHLDANRPAEVL